MSLSVDKAFRQAQSHLKAGELVEAEELYRQVLSKFPKNKKAIQGYQKLKAGITSKGSFGNEPPQEQIDELINFYSLGRFEEVLSKVKPLIGLFPKVILLFNIQGASYAALKRYDAAIDSYKQAIKIKPDYAEAYYNMGIALTDKGDLDAAIDSYQKALKIKPDYADAYNNMGNALKEKGDLDAATDSYKQAIKLNPDHAEAYNNIGFALQEKGDLEAATECYKQAIKIKPDYAEAYYNMGIALKEKGELAAAIDSYKQAIKIKPDYAEAYYNMAFPLQATKLNCFLSDDRLRSLTEGLTSNYSEIAKAILKYELDLGSVSAKKSLDNVVSLLSNTDNSSIYNPNFKNSESIPKPPIREKITALLHFGRSGTGLLHSLIDGHPEVSTLPSIYLSHFFDHSNWKKIIAGGWEEMLNRFISNYEVLFDASSPNPIASKGFRSIKNMGRNEGMVSLGEQGNEILSVDKKVFSEELNCLMAYYDRLDTFTFFELVHSAFDKALNDQNKKSLIFYHIHNPDTYAQLNFLKSAPHTNWLMMVREPVQSCEAWVQKSFKENDHEAVVNRIFQMLFEIDSVILQKENSVGLRLEDLKEDPKRTILALCRWMGIKEQDSLYKMTAQGKKWWGDPNSPDFAKDGMNPFGKTSISRKIGSVFSNNDQLVLRTLFYPFSVRFGYAEENIEQFKIDLQAIRPMLDQMFDFEKEIAMKTAADTEKFMKSCSYLYLRSGMIERWNTLNTFHTYPNMLKPLKIN